MFKNRFKEVIKTKPALWRILQFGEEEKYTQEGTEQINSARTFSQKRCKKTPPTKKKKMAGISTAVTQFLQ